MIFVNSTLEDSDAAKNQIKRPLAVPVRLAAWSAVEGRLRGVPVLRYSCGLTLRQIPNVG